MPNIPKQRALPRNIISPNNLEIDDVKKRKIVCSFGALEYNDYFNLDGTCANWSKALFDLLKRMASITYGEALNGTYNKYGSPFRIHNHKNANVPCAIPLNIEKEDLYQIRISENMGGIHGFFNENVFHVIWLDPLHNMYPSKDRGGLKKIIPPSTCCKERDEELKELIKRNGELTQEIKAYEEMFENVSTKVK